MTIPKEQSIREEASAVGDRAAGAFKDKAGELIDDPALERRGEEQNAAGRARQEANRVTDDITTGQRYVTTFFEDPAEASRAYDRLQSREYPAEDLDVVMSDETRRKHFAETEAGSKAAEGLGIGGAVGGGVGAALATLFVVGSSVAIPGLGLVVAGPIAAALAGAGAGAATGGLIGAMVGAGIPEDRARQYEQGVRDGGVVIGARARDEIEATELERDLNIRHTGDTLGLR
jgi:uncharacterized protein YjbJ (UPF0337 family)